MRVKDLSRFTLLLFLALSACKAGDNAELKDRRVLAIVNGVAITEDDLYLGLQGGHPGAITDKMRDEALEELIREELLSQQGVKLGLDKDAKFQNSMRVMAVRMEAYRRSEMARRMKSSTIDSTVRVSREDAEKYYAEHEKEISTDVHLLVVRFSDQDQARHALDEIKGGVPFETVARGKFGDLPRGRPLPWDAGFLHWNQVPPEWAETISALKEGEVGGVIKSRKDGGFIVMKLLERRKNPDAMFARMSAGVTNRLQEILLQEAYDHTIAKLKAESKIVKRDERGNVF